MLEHRADQPSAIDAFFSTHPTDEARIRLLERQIANLGDSPQRSLVRDTPEFHKVKQYLLALPPAVARPDATQRQ